MSTKMIVIKKNEINTIVKNNSQMFENKKVTIVSE